MNGCDVFLIVRSGNDRAIKGKVYFVLADDNRALVPIVQSYFCKEGVLGKHGGKAIIGIFKDPVTARRFAEIVFNEGEGFVKTSYSTKPFDANLKLD
ncbi:MAG: hypothetical protein EAZ74_03855 [Alphaproteobacteria bacterium]|nr:MAG: hypothetical protein EAY76_00630 [Alphaproteobacteria bacterium]TAF14495.1 MAG: hypothetical protein EAZ74_03855 [Alphaproteobacteria bacterium]TAF76067.1 MAG: hypothetical protein EAZ52_05070 [Alphaproteobacteria bacterium]